MASSRELMQRQPSIRDVAKAIPQSSGLKGAACPASSGWCCATCCSSRLCFSGFSGTEPLVVRVIVFAQTQSLHSASGNLLRTFCGSTVFAQRLRHLRPMLVSENRASAQCRRPRPRVPELIHHEDWNQPRSVRNLEIHHGVAVRHVRPCCTMCRSAGKCLLASSITKHGSSRSRTRRRDVVDLLASFSAGEALTLAFRTQPPYTTRRPPSFMKAATMRLIDGLVLHDVDRTVARLFGETPRGTPRRAREITQSGLELTIALMRFSCPKAANPCVTEIARFRLVSATCRGVWLLASSTISLSIAMNHCGVFAEITGFSSATNADTGVFSRPRAKKHDAASIDQRLAHRRSWRIALFALSVDDAFARETGMPDR